MRGHTDDIIGDQALLFFERERDPKKPFCMLYSFKAPHGNWTPAQRYANAFADIEIPLPPTLEDKLEGRPEALRRTQMSIADMGDFNVPRNLPVAERARLNYTHLVKNYYRVLSSVDDNVGRVLDYLDKTGLAEDTVIVYTSDNGFFLGEHGFFDKRLMYEPSIRHPLPRAGAGPDRAAGRFGAHDPERGSRSDDLRAGRASGSGMHAGTQLPSRCSKANGRPGVTRSITSTSSIPGRIACARTTGSAPSGGS